MFKTLTPVSPTPPSHTLYTPQDDGSYPYPPEEALVKQFSMDEFKGKWYISAGLNPLFDVFDCQVGPYYLSVAV